MSSVPHVRYYNYCVIYHSSSVLTTFAIPTMICDKSSQHVVVQSVNCVIAVVDHIRSCVVTNTLMDVTVSAWVKVNSLCSCCCTSNEQVSSHNLGLDHPPSLISADTSDCSTTTHSFRQERLRVSVQT